MSSRFFFFLFLSIFLSSAANITVKAVHAPYSTTTIAATLNKINKDFFQKMLLFGIFIFIFLSCYSWYHYATQDNSTIHYGKVITDDLISCSDETLWYSIAADNSKSFSKMIKYDPNSSWEKLKERIIEKEQINTSNISLSLYIKDKSDKLAKILDPKQSIKHTCFDSLPGYKPNHKMDYKEGNYLSEIKINIEVKLINKELTAIFFIH